MPALIPLTAAIPLQKVRTACPARSLSRTWLVSAAAPGIEPPKHASTGSEGVRFESPLLREAFTKCMAEASEETAASIVIFALALKSEQANEAALKEAALKEAASKEALLAAKEALQDSRLEAARKEIGRLRLLVDTLYGSLSARTVIESLEGDLLAGFQGKRKKKWTSALKEEVPNALLFAEKLLDICPEEGWSPVKIVDTVVSMYAKLSEPAHNVEAMLDNSLDDTVARFPVRGYLTPLQCCFLSAAVDYVYGGTVRAKIVLPVQEGLDPTAEGEDSTAELQVTDCSDE